MAHGGWCGDPPRRAGLRAAGAGAAAGAALISLLLSAVPAAAGPLTGPPGPAGVSTTTSSTGLPGAPGSTTTTSTTVPPSTTTTAPPSTTTTTAPPRTTTTTTPRTTTTTRPATTTTAPAKAKTKTGAKPKVATAGPPPGVKIPIPRSDPALMASLQKDLDQLQAIQDVVILRSDAAAASGALGSETASANAAAAALASAEGAEHRAALRSAASGQRLADLAVAAYTGATAVNPLPRDDSIPLAGFPGGGANSPPPFTDPAMQTAEAAAMLDAVVSSAQQAVSQSRRQLSQAGRAVLAAAARYRRAVRDSGRVRAYVTLVDAAMSAATRAATSPGTAPPPMPATLAVALDGAHRAARPTVSPLAAITSGAARLASSSSTTSTTTTTTPGTSVAPPQSATPATWDGPTILGAPALDASDMAGWYASTGHQADTTVPMSKLAADYLAAGGTTGVRGDVAFAQSILETDFFSFPSFGQVTKADNNFAGIGACDSCATGWSFPDALTGVTAQMQLLEAYASDHPVPTPLVGPVGVGGCCQTWMSLAGTWATNRHYGIEILTVYQEMLDWAIPRHLAAAGLVPGGRPPATAGPVTPPAPPTTAAAGRMVAPKRG